MTARRAAPPCSIAVAAAFAGQSVDCGGRSRLRHRRDVARRSAPRLPARQNWRLVDNDLGLLARAAALARPPDLTVDGARRSISCAISSWRSMGRSIWSRTSALLDLVSAEWLERLAVETAARRLPVYAALTYNGRVTLEPAEPFDLEIVAAVNRHQRRDKGFGPALGPEAAAARRARFERVGYTVTQRRVGLDVRAGGSCDPGRGARRLGRRRAASSATCRRRDRGVAGAPARTRCRRPRPRMRVGHVDCLRHRRSRCAER